MKAKISGQLSLEYLFLLAVLFGVFAIFLSAALQLFELGLFAVDVKNAKNFALDLEGAIDFLSVLSDGSQVKLVTSPQMEWKIFFQNQQLIIETKNDSFGQSKKIGFVPSLLPRLLVFSIRQDGVVLLEKQGDSVLIKNG
ncbi:MAG: hypothetical protein HYW50_04600 [Candidatus Diapherotrites archaeon]|nr:hypothetical protein [Candidatus Diapherotrites archaeon]